MPDTVLIHVNRLMSGETTLGTPYQIQIRYKTANSLMIGMI